MFRKNFLFALIIAVIGCFIHIDRASAAPQLELKADVGVNNTIKLYTPLPLKLTITNNGTAFSGDLVIDAEVTYSAGSALVIPLDLAEGETKTLSLYLDGLSDDFAYQAQDESIFSFYEGGIEKGKVVDFTGDKKIRPKYGYDGDSIYIFTYTENNDRLAALLRLNQYVQNRVDIFHLNQISNYDFPTDARGFAMADIFFVDEMNIADLSEEKQQAIYKWVEDGGTIVVGASDQVERSIGIFSNFLPLSLSTEKVTVTKEALDALSNGGIFTENIEVYRATEKEGSTTVLADGDTILASSIDLGEGQIIQTTFSLGDQPLSTMDGYGKLLNEMLKLQTNTNYGWHRGSLDYISYELKNHNELFPSFQVKTPILIVTIILYILIIGPILYLLLKRMDKREHAWWVIPAISVVLTLCLFIVGAKDRITNAQINQSAFYKVNEDSLSGYYVESILTNRSGDFVFELDKNTSAFATLGYGATSSNKLHEKSYVVDHANGSTMHLKNVNYWSVQSVIGKTTIPNVGKFEIDLTVKDSRVEGTIKNNFPFRIKDVAIWSGQREIEIGDIEPNETVQVAERLSSSVLLKPTIYSYNWDMPKTKEELIPKRIEQLKYGVIDLIRGNNEPAIVGWAEEALVGIQFDGTAEVSPVAVIIQSFQPKIELQGEFTVDDNMMERMVYPLNNGYASIYDEETNEWDISPGEHEYTVWIPEGLFNEKYHWKEIRITNHDRNNVELSIWNNETNQYEETDDPVTILQGNLENYISEYHEINMQINISENIDGLPIKLPAVEMKGVAQ